MLPIVAGPLAAVACAQLAIKVPDHFPILTFFSVYAYKGIYLKVEPDRIYVGRIGSEPASETIE
jgi:hypothetical protein